MGSTTSVCSRPDPEVESAPELTILTLNVEQYNSFPEDEALGARKLRELTELQNPVPDLVCIQEGREDEDDHFSRLCEVFGYKKLQSSVWTRCPADASISITNQLFLRRDSLWEVVDNGTEFISSKVLLVHEAYKWKPFHLPIRALVWAKLKPKNRASDDGPAAVVLNTHLTGGRYEDQCFLQRLEEERAKQVERVMAFYKLQAGPRDVGVIVGDFNASVELPGAEAGPTRTYFEKSIAGTETLKHDAAKRSLASYEQTWGKFRDYMMVPFAVLEKSGWQLAYDEARVGSSSKFGHLVDYMATSDGKAFKLSAVERLLACKSVVPNGDGDAEVPITDHHGIKATFTLTELSQDPKWYSGGSDVSNDQDAQIKAWLQSRARWRELHPKTKATSGQQYLVVLGSAAGFPTVRAYAAAKEAAEVVGEIPSGKLATAFEHRGDFIRVQWEHIQGWVGVKNCKVAPVAAPAGPGNAGRPSGPNLQHQKPAPTTKAKENASADIKAQSLKSLPPPGLTHDDFHYRVGIQQAEGFPAVRLRSAPSQESKILGEIPNGEFAMCTDHNGDFIRVSWQDLDGWVGLRNTFMDSSAANI